ncbi:hypothetical protein WJX81_002384 [Elliptochloris bilobata]|uniref:Uncharacterized protein n=1 Tax=Elliptochloris bilobata TaxID=381761 RepID=A0AAW1SKH9_9CHLO
MQSALFRRQLTGQPVLRHPYLAELSCTARGAGTIQVNTLNGLHGSPPFCAHYNLEHYGRRFLAIADEEGYVSVVDTSAPLPSDLHLVADDSVRPRAQWEAHKNAIFDLAWAKGDTRMLTASGDQSIGLWDTLSARRISAFHGHAGSVKSVCLMPTCHDVFASGARDGAVLLWDARVPSTTATRPCVMKVQDAHWPSDEWLRMPRKRARAISQHSVTAVLFLRSDHLLATAGAADGVVKFWDVRKFCEPAACLHADKKAKLDCLMSQHTSRSARPFGVTSLAQDPTGGRLLVSATNNTHQLFSTLAPEQPPSAVFKGHIAGSFYVRACFSNSGRHILSGSSDAAAYIWEVDRPWNKPRSPFTPRVFDVQLITAAEGAEHGRPATTGGKLAQRSIRDFFSPPPARTPRSKRASGGNPAAPMQENRAGPLEQCQEGASAAAAIISSACGCTIPDAH